MNLKNKWINSLICFTVGDALGVPYEFKRRKQLENCKIDMIGYGSHNQPKGTWSNDTSLMLALIDTLKAFYPGNIHLIIKFLILVEQQEMLFNLI